MEQVTPPFDPFSQGYFTGIIKLPRIFKPDQYLNPAWQSGQPEIRRKRMFKSNESAPGGYITCLTPSDITFFRQNTEWIIVNDHDTNPDGKWTDRYFVDCDVYYDFLTNGTQNMEHHLTVRVGTYVP